MGIPVRCPFGHEFKVKDKYAGKKGLCPYCKDEVFVRVPDASTSENLSKTAYKIAAQEHGAAGAAASVFDDSNPDDDASASGSMLSSSVIRHNIKCKCGAHVPMWFAKCPHCGHFFEQW